MPPKPSLFSAFRDPEAPVDLFERFPRLREFFRRRRLHAAMRTFGDATFTFIIVSGLFGPQEPDRNVALFLAWGVWWPSVVLSWFVFGRMWCGFCPFPGIGRVMQRLGLSLERPVPRWLQKTGVYWSVGLLALIIWVEESTGMKQWPRGTALLLLAILGGATLAAMIYRKQAWCRYLCPMGRITGVAATFALTEFRPDHEKCRGCKTFACKRGAGGVPGCPVYLGAFNVRNNLHCLVCGHCVMLCDRNSPRLNLRNPFNELILNKGRYITCSYIIPFLMGSQLARFVKMSPAVEDWFCSGTMACQMMLFSVLLFVGFHYVYGVIRLGARFFGVTEDELFGRFSPLVPIFVPLAFAGELSYRLDFALVNAPAFLPTLGRQFGWDLVAWTFSPPQDLRLAIALGILAAGGLAGVYILRRFMTEEFQGMVSRLRYALVLALVGIMLASYVAAVATGVGP
ncbi:4Fe-4S binding protein [Dissulfurirhabdus thermomarina]|uniref:4Fe-4S binding protein n=1 Tax=Dissulfurirhabdus thermomarina TaxID=1765737 RepID=A0A6N9TKN7_DISTH|nr:4Fe-4S binding protein [Dissulfurirhabdus thermomarina]NDY41679.1 4Fe-4S binding protein [Dissulfurirhabdus thermomarina]NMX22753.1 4Fe-4S binding protein [Dissulfurirhabdus thermomarina]